MTDDERSDAEQVLDELDPQPAHEALPVSRRQTLRALASVGALTSVGSAHAQSAGTVVADEAYFSNYGWEPSAEGGTLTIDGDEYTFDGSGEIGLPDGAQAENFLTPTGQRVVEVIGPNGNTLFTNPVLDSQAIETWDSYNVGNDGPGDWFTVNAGSQVTNTRSYSVSNSYLIDADINDGRKYIQYDFTPGQYSSRWRYNLYDEDANSSAGAVRFDNENGDPILFMGTNSPSIQAEGANANTTKVADGQPDQWMALRADFNWNTNEATVEYLSADRTTTFGTATVDLASDTYNIGSVSFTHGGFGGTWGGSGSNKIYWDNCQIAN